MFPMGQSPEAADRHAIKKGLARGKWGDSDKRTVKQIDTVARYEGEVREEAPVSG